MLRRAQDLCALQDTQSPQERRRAPCCDAVDSHIKVLQLRGERRVGDEGCDALVPDPVVGHVNDAYAMWQNPHAPAKSHLELTVTIVYIIQKG